MTYWMWLVAISLAFVAAERIWPRRRSQRMLRRSIWTDFAYVVFNGHILGLLVARLGIPFEAAFTHTLSWVGWDLGLGVARGWPFPLQLAVAFIFIDLVQWSIHNLLHRVPWLWEIHKVHHSVEELDWLASMRFHWGELLVYRILQYPLLALLGFDSGILFVLAVVSTFIGHYNHSNLRLNLGPLKYLFNSPQMHEWHHVHPEAGPFNRNFAINLALWDWVFGTAFLPSPGASPRRLGFPGIERFPRSIFLQELWPLSILLAPGNVPAPGTRRWWFR